MNLQINVPTACLFIKYYNLLKIIIIYLNTNGQGGKADFLKADLKKILIFAKADRPSRKSGKADFFWPRNVKADFAKADFL